jgi:hypothetical protein
MEQTPDTWSDFTAAHEFDLSDDAAIANRLMSMTLPQMLSAWMCLPPVGHPTALHPAFRRYADMLREAMEGRLDRDIGFTAAQTIDLRDGSHQDGAA